MLQDPKEVCHFVKQKDVVTDVEWRVMCLRTEMKVFVKRRKVLVCQMTGQMTLTLLLYKGTGRNANGTNSSTV